MLLPFLRIAEREKNLPDVGPMPNPEKRISILIFSGKVVNGKGKSPTDTARLFGKVVFLW